MDVTAVHRNLDRVRHRIADAGGDVDRVGVLAVTKGFGPDAVEAAVEAGLGDVGENYAQELLGKARFVGPGPRWHFIGRLQSNKVRHLAGTVAVWESLDRPSVIDEVARRSPGAAVFVQVNAADDEAKGGCAPAETADLVARATDAGLAVRGLMTVGVAGDVAATGSAFATVADLADRLDLEHRSMGMSDDLETAVKAGSTLIRVGTALFGPRPANEGP